MPKLAKWHRKRYLRVVENVANFFVFGANVVTAMRAT